MNGEFDLLAVVVAAVAAMLAGALWYSPLAFEGKWRELTETSAESDARNPGAVYGLAFVMMLVAAAVFHAFLGSDPNFGFAIGVGVAAGVAWAAGTLWTSYLFEGRARGLYAVNGGYHILQYTVFGIVFGLF